MDELFSDVGNESQRRVWLLLALICGSLAAIDYGCAQRGAIASLDRSLRASIYGDFRSLLPHRLFEFIQTISLVDVTRFHRDVSLPVTVLVVAVALVFLLARGRPKSSLLVLFSALGAVALASILQRLLPLRPPQELRLHGFPSRHATVLIAVCGAFAYLLYREAHSSVLKVSVLMTGSLLLLIVGFSVLEYHYPSEVIGGYAVGGAWLSFLLANWRRSFWWPHRQNHALEVGRV